MRLLIIMCAILIQSSCSFDNSSRSVFDDYLYRLSNSLDVEIDHSFKEGNHHSSSMLTLYPKKSEMLYDIPTVSINLLQFLRLSTCDLQRLIGQRNSSLGKLMTGYHSLLYEHEFLMLARRCQEMIDPGNPLYAELVNVIEHKQSYKDQLHWNATFAGDEIRHLFSLSTRILTPQQLSRKPVELVGALETLNTWLSNPTSNSTGLQYAYKTFETRKHIGKLRLTMAMAVSALTQADSLITKRLSQKPLCYNQKANQKFEIVYRIFRGFYIGEVQPILAQLHLQGRELFSLIDQLQGSMETGPKFTEFWANVYTSQDSEWQDFNKAIEEHVSSWQSLLTQCGHSPG